MQKFIKKDIDLLVCTTIIESGIDIENANTLIVENSENYGLSQLHQIRGRVGSSKREAFAYFLLNETKKLKNKALERIEALQENESLLSGFSLAMRFRNKGSRRITRRKAKWSYRCRRFNSFFKND